MLENAQKILLIGSTGMLGSALKARLSGFSGELFLTSFPEVCNGAINLDITDEAAVEAVFDEIKPDIVFNCAAYTNVDQAEADLKAAMLVNGTAPKILAQNCKEYGSLLVHISTDYVFNGFGNIPYKPEDKVDPTTVYGQSKFSGEKGIQDVGCEHIIIRTSWLFGPGGNNFVKTIKNLASTRDEIKVVNDQVGCPTYTLDLADCMIGLAERKCSGIYHFCNPPACSWFDFATEIVDIIGLSCKVTPCTTKDFPRPAPRPAYSVLDISKTEQALERKTRDWKESLRHYLQSKTM